MTDSEQHPYVELIAREARRPVSTDPAARARIMAAVRAEPLPARPPRMWERVLEPRSFRLSPVATSLIAAGLVGIGIFGGGFVHNRDGGASAGRSPIAVVPHGQLPVTDTVVRFVLVAPTAANVSLVGDFNGWDSTKTPMARAAANGVWSVTLPMAAGRHVYSFVVDGSWSADPSAPLAPDDGFGHSNSVRIVSRGSTL
jgi:hypothetical protein